MNQKRVGYDGRRPEYLHEVTVNGRKLLKGMEATLHPECGRKEKRRYEFKYAELVSSPTTSTLMLTFYGPVRSARAKYRTVREADVLIVHSKSEARS